MSSKTFALILYHCKAIHKVEYKTCEQCTHKKKRRKKQDIWVKLKETKLSNNKGRPSRGVGKQTKNKSNSEKKALKIPF